MNDPGQAGTTSSPASRHQNLRELLARFEAGWRSGVPPRLEDYKDFVEVVDRTALSQALIAVERAERDRLNVESTVEDVDSDSASGPDQRPGDGVPGSKPKRLGDESTVADPDLQSGAVHHRVRVADRLLGLSATSGPPSPERAGLSVTSRHDFRRPAGLEGAYLSCPHCHCPIGTFRGSVESVVCPECASSFRVEGPGVGSTLEQPRYLSRFRLLERVGNGAFGVVWRAFDTKLERTVALKIPHPSLLESPDFLERFWREAQAAAALRHPGIVPVHEAIAESTLTAIVSDFVEGASLKDLLEVRKLTFHEAARFVEEIAQALHHAHEKGLVHRDVKPANIMIDFSDSAMGGSSSWTNSGNKHAGALGRPLIVDFGLALRDEAEIVLTLDGQIIGTPAYMSPEQAAGKGHNADRRSDVYCLGVVLYELLCGELPFRGSRAMVVHQVVHELPRPPRRVNDKVPRDLETICLKAMAKEPGWRYATAADMADDLHRYLERRPILARHTGRPEQAWRWCRRNPGLALVSGLACAAAISFMTLFVVFAMHKAQSVERLTRLSASVALEHGLSQCEMGNVPIGLLWLARALELAPADASDQQRVIRLNLSAWNRESARLRQFVAGAKDVVLACLAPDGTALLTVSERNRVELRHLAPGGPPAVTFEVQSPVVAVALDSSGRLIVTSHSDTSVQLWDGSTGKPRGPALKHAKEVVALALSRDGTKLATSAKDKCVRIWRVSDGALIGGPLEHRSSVRAMEFDPSAGLLMCASANHNLHLWDVASGRKRFEIADAAMVCCGSFSPDGKRLATASLDQTARIWDVMTGKPHGLPMVHQELVRTVAFSPDGKLLLTASHDKTVRLWNADSTQPALPSLPHTTRVVGATFLPDGRSFASVGEDGSVRLWDCARGEPGDRLEHKSDITCVAVSIDGRRAVTASGAGAKTHEARLWELPAGRLVTAPIPLPHSTVTCAFDRAGRFCLIATHDGTVFLVDAASGEMRRKFFADDMLTTAIFCSGDQLICTGNVHGDVRLWRTETGEPAAPSLTMAASITALCGSVSTSSVLVGTQDGTVGAWDTNSGDFHQERRHKAEVLSLRFGADDTVVISGSWDHRACIHTVGPGQKERNTYLEHDDRVTALAVSPDGKLILTGCADHKVHLWDAASGKPNGRPLSHGGLVSAAAFNADGMIVVTGSWDRTARMWDMVTRRPIGTPLEHEGLVQSIAFSPKASTYITGGFDGTARLWRIPAEIRGDPARIVLWCEVITGVELDDNDSARVLDATSWHNRCLALEELGGPPRN